MTGFLHLIVPHDDFELVPAVMRSAAIASGPEPRSICSAACGVKSFYQPRSHPKAWSLNANCVDQPVELAIERFDGANWEAGLKAVIRQDHSTRGRPQWMLKQVQHDEVGRLANRCPCTARSA